LKNYDIIGKQFGNSRKIERMNTKMSIKVEKTENNNELKLSFTIEAEKFEEAIQKVYAKSAKYFNIPGFRKGKAPYKIVEKQYGAQIFYEDAFNEVVPEIYEKELKENNIIAVSRPDIDITQMEKGKDLIFTAVVQTKPEVKLGKYKGIELKKIEYTVTDEDINHELGHMQERNSRLVNVENRSVESGDTTVIDFEGFVDGVAFEGGKAEGHELVIGSNTFIPGFEDQIIGMNIDEEKDINVKFPEEYFSKDLAGKDAVFKVKLHEIKKKELPKLDDEFAKDVSEFDTLDELKASIKEKLEEQNVSKAKYETEDEAIKAVSENTNIDIPSGMIETEIDNMIREIEQRLSYQGLTLAQYLQMMNKTESDMRKELEEQAKTSVKTKLVLEAIVVAEKIEASEEELKAKIEEMANTYGNKVEDLEKNESLKLYIEEAIKSEKAISFIVDNAKIK
jgi:trigger factor